MSLPLEGLRVLDLWALASHKSVISSWRRVEKMANAIIFCIGMEEGR